MKEDLAAAIIVTTIIETETIIITDLIVIEIIAAAAIEITARLLSLLRDEMLIKAEATTDFCFLSTLLSLYFFPNKTTSQKLLLSLSVFC